MSMVIDGDGYHLQNYFLKVGSKVGHQQYIYYKKVYIFTLLPHPEIMDKPN